MASGTENGEFAIGERFVVLTRQGLPPLGGNEVVAVRDRAGGRGGLGAMRISLARPFSQRLSSFMTLSGDGLLLPVAVGHTGEEGGGSGWIVTEMPTGAALETVQRSWTESQLLNHVLKPIAATLELLQAHGLTHRAIRANNVFLREGGRSVLLGPCWHVPGASQQPTLYEPPYVGVCQPEARGPGSIADDVYALGVLLLVLHGGEPLRGLSEREIVRRKLEMGSFAALTDQRRLPGALHDAIRAMLSEDPDLRPTPAALAELTPGHERRSVRRAAPRAARSLEFGGQPIWNLRMLALAIAEQPQEAFRALRMGFVDHWLRRGLEAVPLANKIDEVVRLANLPDTAEAERLEATILMRVVSLLDPLAPMLWEGRWIWPSAVGAVLADAVLGDRADGDAICASLRLAIEHEATTRWAAIHPQRHSHEDRGGFLRVCRAWLSDRPALALPRLLYTLNPNLPCISPLVRQLNILRPEELLAGLERQAPRLAEAAALVDHHCLAFLAVRDDPLAQKRDREEAARNPDAAELIALASLQSRLALPPAPQIAARLAAGIRAQLAHWPGRRHREKRLAQLTEAVQQGALDRMLSLIADEAALHAAAQQREQAGQQIDMLRNQIEALAASRPRLAERASQVAAESGIGLGLLGVAVSVMLELFG